MGVRMLGNRTTSEGGLDIRQDKPSSGSGGGSCYSIARKDNPLGADLDDVKRCVDGGGVYDPATGKCCQKNAVDAFVERDAELAADENASPHLISDPVGRINQTILRTVTDLGAALTPSPDAGNGSGGETVGGGNGEAPTGHTPNTGGGGGGGGSGGGGGGSGGESGEGIGEALSDVPPFIWAIGAAIVFGG